MIDLRDYVVERCTTDKLEERLNEMALVFDELQPTFTGGRDWVIVASRPTVPTDDPVSGNVRVASSNRTRFVP